MNKLKDFLKKNVSSYHIIGCLIGMVLTVIYWYKAGRFSDYILKNNLALVILWGVAVGYITADFVKNAISRKDKNE